MSDIAPPAPITITIATAKALLAFAGTDETRPQVAIGVDSGLIGATDGHTAIRFFHVDRAVLAPYEGRVWSAESVATAIKIARARKEPTIDLRMADALPGVQFPPLAKVCPSWASHRIADDQGPACLSGQRDAFQARHRARSPPASQTRRLAAYGSGPLGKG